jgi:DNA-binding MarR family transcriptional regulator
MTTTQDQWRENAPELDTSPMEIVALIKSITAMFERAVEPLFDGAPLSAPELDMLIALRHDPEPVIARRLADRMRISRAAAGKTLAKLEKHGFVGRERSLADGRAQLVSVTEAGKQTVDGMFPRQLAREAELLAGLGEDRDRVIDALTTLAQAMERYSGPRG